MSESLGGLGLIVFEGLIGLGGGEGLKMGRSRGFWGGVRVNESGWLVGERVAERWLSEGERVIGGH